ncbi:MAG: glycosyltransferase family 2 protein, partial [Mycoplasmataceae bacterium]|nr:glycosyltransferase family 2 protein [Mycoplasmataceae bacterium]
MQIDLTIIIPCYNVEKFILNALNSIINQNQNFLNYEVLIVDDGSKDRSFELTKHFIEKNNVKNFKLIEKTNGNWGSVINYAKNNNLINGKYVTILDADDLFTKNCFENIQNKLNN